MRYALMLPMVVVLGGSLLLPAVHADVLVIAHPENPLQAITTHEVSDLYLGRRHSAGMQATSATVFELPDNSPVRENFFRALNGMSISQLNAYWARLRFSGEVLPPVALPDSRSVVKAVSNNRRAIGYVDAAAVSDASVKVLLRLQD